MSDLREAIVILTELRDQLPRGHHDLPGLIRAIVVLRSVRVQQEMHPSEDRPAIEQEQTEQRTGLEMMAMGMRALENDLRNHLLSGPHHSHAEAPRSQPTLIMPIKAHVSVGRDHNGVEHTLCGLRITWTVEDHNEAARQRRWCQECRRLDA